MSIGLLRTILIMSASGGIIALVLFALKPLLRNRIPKSAQYYLWLVVVVALLVPFSRFVALSAASTDALTISQAVERYVITSEEERNRLDPSYDPSADGVPSYWENPQAEQPRRYMAFVDVFSLLYPLGVGAVLLYHILAYALFLRKIRRSNTATDIDCVVPVFRNAKAQTPMLIGLFRPAIILPDAEYTDEQLRAVLLHELTHLRRKDVLVKWLSVLACSVHWFNPIVWLVRREIDRACELSCDEAVIRNLDATDRQNYGDTLIYVAADSASKNGDTPNPVPRAVLSTTMCEDKKDLKERLIAIMKNKKSTRAAIIVSAVLIIGAVFAACALGAGNGTNSQLSFSPAKIQSIALNNGTTGGRYFIDDNPTSQFIVQTINGLKFRRSKKLEPSTGWEIGIDIDLAEGTPERIVMREDGIVYRGYLYANGKENPLYMFAKLLTTDKIECLHIIGGQSKSYVFEAETGAVAEADIVVRNTSYLELVKWFWGLKISSVNFAEGQRPNDAEGGEVFSFDNGNYGVSYYIGGGGDYYIFRGNDRYKVENPSGPPLENAASGNPLSDRRPMLMIGGKIYLDTGKLIDVEVDAADIAGYIESTVNQSEIPTENGQSNFGNIGNPYVFIGGNLIVLINEEWVLFGNEYAAETSAPANSAPAPLTPQAQITSYLTDMMTAAYNPFYEGLRFEMGNYAEMLDGKTITATFYWTMYHLNNGLDVSYEIGLEEQGNFSLQATAQLDENGIIVPVTMKILSDTSVRGPAEYTMPVEHFFNDMPEPTQTQILAKNNSAAAAVARSYYAENGFGEIKGLTVIEISDLAKRALKDETVSFGIDLVTDDAAEEPKEAFDATILLTREFGGEWEIVDVVIP